MTAAKIPMNRLITILLLLVTLVSFSTDLYGKDDRVMTHKVEDNGFEYYISSEGAIYSSPYLITINGDTILKFNGYASIEFIPDPVYGGFFKVWRSGGVKSIYDMRGKGISFNCEWIDVKRTECNKVYFQVKSDISKDKMGICDIMGNVIIDQRKVKYPNRYEYDSTRNEFYILNHHNGKRKNLGIGLPDLNYDSIASSNMRLMKEYTTKKDTVYFTDREVNGFFYREMKKGIHIGIADWNGETIIPLEDEYSTIEFMPLQDGFGCFKAQKGNKYGLYDLNGNVIIPLEDGYSTIEFLSLQDGLGCFRVKNSYYVGLLDLNGNAIISVDEKFSDISWLNNKNLIENGIPGFWVVQKNKETELRDIAMETVLPFDNGKIRFYPEGKIGYFERSGCGKYGGSNSVYDLAGNLIYTVSRDYNLYYSEENGFYYNKVGKYKNSTYLGIFLDQDGIADFSRVQEYEAREREKKQRKAQLWGNIALAAVGLAGDLLSIQQQAHQAKQYNKSARSSGNNSKRSSTGNNSKRSSTSQLNSNSRNSRSSSPYPLLCTKEEYDKYLSPEAFVYNYTHGLPTLPPSQQTGLTGSDAYAYDIQRNLLHQQQLMDLSAQRETQRLVNDGMQRAQTEIQNFSSIYGREPTPQEMEAIYKGYTQGYIDAYAEYVNETVAASKELGLGSIERTKPNSSNSTDNSSSTGSTSTSTTSKNTSTSSQSKTDKTTSDKDNNKKGNTGNKDKKTEKKDAHEQFKSGNNNVSSSDYGDKIRNVSFYVKDGAKYRKSNTPSQGELYKKGANYYVKVGGTFFKVFNTSGPYNSYIIYGSAAYYF